jgi:hypothetical protein
MEEGSTENIEILKEKIVDQIFQILASDSLTEEEKTSLFEEAFSYLNEN